VKAIREAAAGCRACPLWRNATQTVFGAGAARAPVMLIGEQPGDREDREGLPFVGPAGHLLDRALEKAGIEPRRTYRTNAVKHFKWKPRGKRRIHQTPSKLEVQACRPWLEAELERVKPDVVGDPRCDRGQGAARRRLSRLAPARGSARVRLRAGGGRHLPPLRGAARPRRGKARGLRRPGRRPAGDRARRPLSGLPPTAPEQPTSPGFEARRATTQRGIEAHSPSGRPGGGIVPEAADPAHHLPEFYGGKRPGQRRRAESLSSRATRSFVCRAAIRSLSGPTPASTISIARSGSRSPARRSVSTLTSSATSGSSACL
jgi:uracil-DNA glycosylase family 4